MAENFDNIDNWYWFDDIGIDDYDELYYEDKTIIDKKNIKYPQKGIFKVYTPLENVLLEMNFSNGKKNGITKCYFNEKNIVSWINRYTDGQLDGICQKFREDGSIEKEESFVNGVKEGVERLYYVNGKIEQEIMYKGNKQNGFAKKYYENGQLKHEAHFIEDKQEGITRQYYESGALEYEGQFKNDNAIGWGIRYYEDGNIKWKSPHGRTKGKEIKYYPNGNIEFEIETIGEKRNGKYFDYYENGKIKAEGYYKNDKKEGISKYYYENGKLEAEYSYKKGKKDGDCKEFHNSGKLREIKPYKNGKLHGTRKRYYNNGNLSYEYNFKNDLRDGYSISYKEKTGEIELKQFFRKGELVDFYSTDGITGVKGIGKYRDENGTHIVKTREITKEEKEDWDNKNLIFFYITNEKRTIATLLLFNTKLKKTPIILEKIIKNTKEELNKAAQEDYFIIENNELADKLSQCKVHEIIPDGLFVDIGAVLNSILKLKSEYNIDRGLLCKNKVFIPNDNTSSSVNEKKNKNIIKSDKEIKDFRLDLLNCSRDIEFLTEKIIASNKKNFSICIYGDPGTGKSAYARYLADKLGLEVITKSAADLLDQYVGNGEQKIQEAFEEAAEKKAMLVIDEVDSFLRSRGLAQRNWEVTMVNQMLTCMEHFNYPFVCTTNFIDTLDQASLRRFTFKLKFGFLKESKIEAAFEHIFKMKPNNKILKMNGLTVSDFVNVKKECDILDIKDLDSIVKMLDEIISLKESEDLKSNMGFN